MMKQNKADKELEMKITKIIKKVLKELDGKTSTISDVVTDKKGNTIRFVNEREMQDA